MKFSETERTLEMSAVGKFLVFSTNVKNRKKKKEKTTKSQFLSPLISLSWVGCIPIVAAVNKKRGIRQRSASTTALCERTASFIISSTQIFSRDCKTIKARENWTNGDCHENMASSINVRHSSKVDGHHQEKRREKPRAKRRKSASRVEGYSRTLVHVYRQPDKREPGHCSFLEFLRRSHTHTHTHTYIHTHTHIVCARWQEKTARENVGVLYLGLWKTSFFSLPFFPYNIFIFSRVTWNCGSLLERRVNLIFKIPQLQRTFLFFPWGSTFGDALHRLLHFLSLVFTSLVGISWSTAPVELLQPVDTRLSTKEYNTHTKRFFFSDEISFLSSVVLRLVSVFLAVFLYNTYKARRYSKPCMTMSR